VSDESPIRGRPWLRFYRDVPATLDYPNLTVHGAVMDAVRRFPGRTAYEFLGATATYRELGASISRCADALAVAGLGPGDRLTIALPTSPQGAIAFYAAAKLGAVSSIIHPLSTAAEIGHYLELSRSRVALTLDLFHERLVEQDLDTLIVTGIADCLPAPSRLAYRATRGRKAPRIAADPRIRRWSELEAARHPPAGEHPTPADAPAAILYSSGTTGAPKGILLSHRNFTAEALQVAHWVGLSERDTILAALPIFHGFGLGALVHTGFTSGAKVVLVPRVAPALVARLLGGKRVTLTAGVPTLFEALTHSTSLARADLSALRAAFSGADTLPAPVRERFEELVRRRGGNARLLEGYGLTEAVSAVAAMPLDEQRADRVGLPLPDMDVKVCRFGTTEEVGLGEDGELCVAGPTVMLGYLDDPDASAEVLRRHDDGRIFLHTGDVGSIDGDGFVRFEGRLKRMIKTSGFNVYPAQVEAVLLEHPAVESACVVGIPDVRVGERVKAFVLLRDPDRAGDDLADELVAHCRERLIKWSCPREIEFRPELPTTRVGKIDFAALLREELERAGA
jgi:long-chain acyl-CoA synthetase